MEDKKLNLIKNILSQLKLNDIIRLNEKSALLTFNEGIRIYIDSTDFGLEFSIETMNSKGLRILKTFENL